MKATAQDIDVEQAEKERDVSRDEQQMQREDDPGYAGTDYGISEEEL